jgi:hypothetical protein
VNSLQLCSSCWRVTFKDGWRYVHKTTALLKFGYGKVELRCSRIPYMDQLCPKFPKHWSNKCWVSLEVRHMRSHPSYLRPWHSVGWSRHYCRKWQCHSNIDSGQAIMTRPSLKNTSSMGWTPRLFDTATTRPQPNIRIEQINHWYFNIPHGQLMDMLDFWNELRDSKEMGPGTFGPLAIT